MVNTILACLALVAAVTFYAFLDDAVAARQAVIVQAVDVWHCDGWAGKMYPTEKSMKEAVK